MGLIEPIQLRSHLFVEFNALICFAGFRLGICFETAVWRVFYQDFKGRTRTKTTGSRDEVTAKRRLRLFEKEFADGRIQDRDCTTGEFYKQYRVWAKAHGLTRHTIDSQLQRVRALATWKAENSHKKEWKAVRLSRPV